MSQSLHTEIRKNRRSQWLEQAQQGQGLVEYALSLVLVGMVASVSLAVVGPAINEAPCEAVETLNPALGDSCTSEATLEESEDAAPGPITILFAKYDDKKNELDIQAKAPHDCPFDLQVAGLGTMTRAGESFVFKYTEVLSPPPASVTVGHPSCGWSTSPVG